MSNDSATKSPRVLSDSEHGKVIAAVKALHGVLAGAEFSKDGTSALPAFSECSTEELGYVLGRTVRAIEAHDAAVIHNVMKGTKEKVDTLLHAARLTKIKAWKKLSAFAAENPDVGLSVQTPTEAHITVADAMSSFPEGTTPDNAVKMLVKQSFKVSAGKTALERKIVSPIVAEHLAL